jgi:hypothetical protein
VASVTTTAIGLNANNPAADQRMKTNAVIENMANATENETIVTVTEPIVNATIVIEKNADRETETLVNPADAMMAVDLAGRIRTS